MTIQSDSGSANQKATALKNATDQLITSSTVQTDTQTTVSGNTDAQKAITICQQTATKIAQAVHTASGNIQSIAKDFEAMDNEVSKSFKLGGIVNDSIRNTPTRRAIPSVKSRYSSGRNKTIEMNSRRI